LPAGISSLKVAATNCGIDQQAWSAGFGDLRQRLIERLALRIA